ncbi:hypothetical protein [Luteimonas terrae]|uniref:hypothetical protein n=1 Tax=Luteimonas terrae TaxID=1530191 RepID=UPI0014053757|nr:hypothetical protein [Luteimonas terrae]
MNSSFRWNDSAEVVADAEKPSIVIAAFAGMRGRIGRERKALPAIRPRHRQPLIRCISLARRRPLLRVALRTQTGLVRRIRRITATRCTLRLDRGRTSLCARHARGAGRLYRGGRALQAPLACGTGLSGIACRTRARRRGNARRRLDLAQRLPGTRGRVGRIAQLLRGRGQAEACNQQRGR